MLNGQAIDIARLRRDLVSAALESTQLKRLLRTTWTRPMADEQQRLAVLQWRVTRLCILRARVRGRYHLANPPRKWRDPESEWNQEQFHAKIAERMARDYELPAPCETASG